MLDDLILYKKHIDLMYYSYNLLVKFPRSEKIALVGDIKNCLFVILRNIIYYNNENSIVYLNNVLIEIKVLLVLIRISYKMRYINNKNYLAFSKKITVINNLCLGLIKHENNKK